MYEDVEKGLCAAILSITKIMEEVTPTSIHVKPEDAMMYSQTIDNLIHSLQLVRGLIGG